MESELCWPIRGHEYLPEAPVIYTYRHPVEAYLSLRSRFRTDVGKFIPSATGEKKKIMGMDVNVIDTVNKSLMTEEKADYHAMVAIGTQWAVWQDFKRDAAAGRDVLLLRYEDYFSDRLARINAVAEFMGVDLSSDEQREIYEYTSLERNTTRSLDSRFAENQEVTFSHGYLEESGMQKGHINLEMKGVPGAYLEAHPKFTNSVKTGILPALEALNEMTLDMGYEI